MSGNKDICEAVIYLASNTAFQQDGLILADELQVFEHLDALLVVGQELEVLLAQRHPQAE